MDHDAMSKLLQEFTTIPTIDKAWTFESESEDAYTAMFLISQTDLLSNNRRKSILSTHISRKIGSSVSFDWAPFPTEMTGVSAVVPSPSGSKLLLVRNFEGEHSSACFEIWGPSQLKEFRVPRSIHGPVYTDGWLEGISWNSNETFIAYVAEAPDLAKPAFNTFGLKKEDHNSWKGQGDWEEDWGETYSGKKQPAIFVIDVNSGEICGVAVTGAGRELCVGQVVWAPPLDGKQQQHLVFVGWWPSDTRKFGIKYCYNRPCSLYAVEAPSFESDSITKRSDAAKVPLIIELTHGLNSAFFPRFSPDGKSLVFLSAKTSVDSGAHSATQSLHKIEWPSNGKLGPLKVADVVPVIMCPENGCFPGLYCSSLLCNPWLSDGHTMFLSSAWGSVQTILSVNILSGNVSRITPNDSRSSWDVLAVGSDNVISVCSSPVSIPEIKYGSLVGKWRWWDVSSPISKCSDKVSLLLASQQFDILSIPVRDVSENLAKGACKPFEAIYVSSRHRKSSESPDPLVVFLHGGPHTVSLASFSKSLAFLSSLGYSLLIVNYSRGSLGFGEEALQSLLGNIGSQDVRDVLTALDAVIDKGLADPSKIFVLGGSHGGFFTTHLIGQAPEMFAAAATRNPLCNIPLLFGTSDIPDWCFAEVFGGERRPTFTESRCAEHLALFYSKSPIAHVSKVKTPTIFLLGARDIRLPMCNGIQFARALRERGVETKVIVFPNDEHSIDRPQSDYESYLNIGMWFNKHCK
ncbi:acylamino-acid-releasing enzyme 1-like isoform X3 [Salvia splendens]|uniref:acylamino-acid-releasing enzyme 1-like isoform X3 n=1 Tax=Salvia splendens TaxID=180675 RepID=UPI001C25C3B5|nr:acylamino-acid-releasing enzyme 1-like isoform X3 [Salvia splendens]